METFTFLLLVGVNSAAAARHSFKYFLTGSSGIPSLPEFVGVAMVDDVQVGYCDNIVKRAVPKHDWIKKIKETDQQQVEWHDLACSTSQYHFKPFSEILKQQLNQTEGVSIVQQMVGCEWDDETGEVNGFNQYSYNGEDIIALDLKTLTWVAPKSQAVIVKHKWDGEKARLDFNKMFLTKQIPGWLKEYLEYGKSFLLRTDLPSVSLLQKSPSSPVSCHATGFYPDRADLFWRKDGEEIHEDVDKGEILPNTDGTFQMNVDLNILSVKPEDWSRYDCVFQLSTDKIVTKLDKDVIRTNWGKTDRNDEVSPSVFPAAVIGVVVVLLLLSVCITGLFIIIRKKNNGFRPANASDSSDKDSYPDHGTEKQVE